MRPFLISLVLAFLAAPAFATDGVPEYADLLANCATANNAACPGQQTALAPQWPKALAGDIPSLRNFAFCIGDGCYGAFKVDPVRACALRIVVAAIGERPVPADDRDNFEKACNMLGEGDQQSAKVQARDLVRAIRRGLR